MKEQCPKCQEDRDGLCLSCASDVFVEAAAERLAEKYGLSVADLTEDLEALTDPSS